MTPDLTRRLLRYGVAALVLLAPLPFGSVRAGAVLAIELWAAALGLIAIYLLGRDEEARAALPRAALWICGAVIALGIVQIVPLPFAIAEKFNPTADLVRPLIPYLGLPHPPSVSWSVAAPETTDALLRFIAYVLIGLASAVAFDDTRSRRRFAVVLVVAAVFQAVYGSGEYLSGHQHIFAFAKKYYLDSATGTFINRNHFATMLAIALPMGLALAIQASQERTPRSSWRERLVAATDGRGLSRLLVVIACTAMWLGLLLSHSRAGLIAAVLGAAVVLLHFRHARAARWAAAVGASLLLLLLSLQLARAPGERFLDLKDDASAESGRLAVWRDAARLVAARPVAGWGLGTFESAFPTVRSAQVEQRFDHAHNDWLQWAAEGGVFSIAAASTLLVLAVMPLKRRGDEVDAPVDTAVRAAVLAVATHALWDFSLRIPAIAVVTAALLGVALSRARSAKLHGASVSEFRRTSGAVGA